ncbi:hypothetical protein EYF80_024950 [Liparis tanakae]|uniref:Uncharacterized protein n=1 Tax=Liparis tanakae TaxID=230148 RepID=A0A4Z2HG65_9TELE|nr:hypothetical protein EYF80_024950 [Liparis tanakae]
MEKKPALRNPLTRIEEALRRFTDRHVEHTSTDAIDTRFTRQAETEGPSLRTSARHPVQSGLAPHRYPSDPRTAEDKESSATLLERCSIPVPHNQRTNNNEPMG